MMSKIQTHLKKPQTYNSTAIFIHIQVTAFLHKRFCLVSMYRCDLTEGQGHPVKPQETFNKVVKI